MQPQRRQELEDAVREAATAGAANEVELARLRQPSSRSGSTTTARNLLVIAIALLAWIWIGKPTWVFGDRPAPPTPARAEAGARYGIYLEQSLIEEYLEQQGRLPESLGELGANPGIVITLSPGGGSEYELSAKGPNGPLVYSSRMDVDSFLGNSLEVLRQEIP